MAFETLKSTLTETGIDPAVVDEIIANEKAAAAINTMVEGGLRQSDYDRKMNAGKAELAAEQARVKEMEDRLAAERERMNQQYIAAMREREASETALASIRAKARTAAQTYGIDIDKELFGDGAPPVAAAAPPPAPVTAVSPDLERRLKDIEDMFGANFNLQAEMLDLQNQHAELFPGQKLDFRGLMQDAIKQRRTPMQVWDDKFGATARREEILAERYRKEGESRANEAWEKRISGSEASGFRQAAPAGPLLQQKDGGNKIPQPKDINRNSSDRASAAVAAFLSGKYRATYAGAEK